MILRLSQKLNAKIKGGTLSSMPLDENPLADWSAHLFVVDRTQYILVSNTKSLYSVVFYAKGSTNDSHLIERVMSNLREFMEDDGLAFAYHRFIAPTSASVRFAKALDRSVTGSMGELIVFATAILLEGELSPYDVGFKINDMLLSAIAPSKSDKYAKPNEAFRALVDGIGS